MMPDPIEKFFLPGGLFFYFYFEKTLYFPVFVAYL